MKHKKLIATITLLLFAITLLPTAAFAATPGTKVTATIPTFKVTMNGQVVDNTYRQYPFLVYNDITYFPMTYWDMRFLGVSNTWSAETGSVIVADGTSSEYKPTLTDVKNKTKNTATVNTGAFKVNGKVIDNAKEEYPILSFRDVPYFPLTWNWCQEFGWNISFDGTNGLAVNTTKNTLPKQNQTTVNEKKATAQKIIQLVLQNNKNLIASSIRLIESQKYSDVIYVSVNDADKIYYFKDNILYDYDVEIERISRLSGNEKDNAVKLLESYMSEMIEEIIEEIEFLEKSKTIQEKGSSLIDIKGEWKITYVYPIMPLLTGEYTPLDDKSNIVFYDDGTFKCFMKTVLMEREIMGEWKKVEDNVMPYELYCDEEKIGAVGAYDTTNLIIDFYKDMLVNCSK